MKKLLISLILISGSLRTISQIKEIEEFNSLVLRTRSASAYLEYNDIEGNPYSNKELIHGTIQFVSGNRIDSIPMRYNWYSNEMEFEHLGEILSMPASKDIDHIVLAGSKYVPFTYLKNINGYMVELCQGTYSLFRREDVRFVDAVPPQSGYDQYQPPKFQWYRTQYIVITNTGDIIELELNKKKLPIQFPGYEEIAKNYIDSAKLNVKQEEDLKELIQKINTDQQP